MKVLNIKTMAVLIKSGLDSREKTLITEDSSKTIFKFLENRLKEGQNLNLDDSLDTAIYQLTKKAFPLYKFVGEDKLMKPEF